MTNKITLDKAVAREFATAIMAYIPDFVERNKEGYLRYLVETQQQALDPYYASQIVKQGQQNT